MAAIRSLLFGSGCHKLFTPASFSLIVSSRTRQSVNNGTHTMFRCFVNCGLNLATAPGSFLGRSTNDAAHSPHRARQQAVLSACHAFNYRDNRPAFHCSLLSKIGSNFLVGPCMVSTHAKIAARLLSSRNFIIAAASRRNGRLRRTFTNHSFRGGFFTRPAGHTFYGALLRRKLHSPVSNRFNGAVTFIIDRRRTAGVIRVLGRVTSRL